MPYKSDAQRRFFHSEGAKKAGISEKTIKEFDEASKGQELPEKVGKPKSIADLRKIAKAKGVKNVYWPHFWKYA